MATRNNPPRQGSRPRSKAVMEMEKKAEEQSWIGETDIMLDIIERVDAEEAEAAEKTKKRR